MTTLAADRVSGLDDGPLEEALPGLLTLAVALTGTSTGTGTGTGTDTAAGTSGEATDLVAAALSRRPALTRQLARSEYAESRLRPLVVQQFLSTYRRRSPRGLEGLDALTTRARAAVVLRDGCWLTAAEIASVLDRPIAQINADLDTAPDAAAEIAALHLLAPDPAAVRGRLGIAARRHRSRRLRFLMWGSVLAVLVAIAVLIPTVVLPRLPADSRPQGTWRFSHQIRPVAGWTVESRSITPTLEVSQLTPPVAEDDPYRCWVQVSVAGAYDPDAQRATQQTQVHGRPAFFGMDRTENAFLAWEYGDDAWASVSCTSLDENSVELRRLADMVRFAPEEVAIPFRLRQIPDGYRIQGLTVYPESHVSEVQLARTEEVRPGDVHLVITGPLQRVSNRGAERITVGGRSWALSGGSDPRLCTTGEGPVLCAAGFWPGGDWPAPAPYPRFAPNRLRATAELLEPAADLQDPAGWPVASQLPG